MHKLLAVTLALVLVAGLGSPAFAAGGHKGESNTTKIIHLGYLQLAAHDFFDMNRDTETDNENGKLDLSTVLFNPKAGQCNFEKAVIGQDGCALYSDEAIANGGEKRSAENIMISTASAEVGEKYLHYVELGEENAYKKTLTFYHKQIETAYEESFHLDFPEPREGKVSNLHNLAVRAGHDFLPAEIMYNHELTSLFAIFPLGEKLSEQEQRQPSSPVDGEFDIEFTGIDFCPVPPDFCIKVDLLEADQSFGKQFKDKDLDLDKNTFDEFMAELSDGIFDETDRVSILLDEVFAIGINLD
jgi:hypothetical protein